jgi:hypothetical protein
MAIRNAEFFEVLLPDGAQKYGLIEASPWVATAWCTLPARQDSATQSTSP